MAAPRLERDDLVDMAAVNGECYPYEVDLDAGGRTFRCACTPSLELPWPHSH